MQEKLARFAKRMVDLIQEAEKEGIALTLSSTEVSQEEQNTEAEDAVKVEKTAVYYQLPLTLLPHTSSDKAHFVRATAAMTVTEDGIKELIKPSPTPIHGLPLVPVYRPGVNDDMFIDTANLPTRRHAFNDIVIQTAPLKFGVKMDIIGISNDELLLESGLQDNTDSLDPAISLRNIYVEIAENVFEVSVAHTATNEAIFDHVTHGNYRDMKMVYANFITIDSNTHLISKENNKTALVKQFLAGATVKLGIDVMGTINLQLGALRLDARHVVSPKITAHTAEATEASEQLSHYLSKETIKLMGYEIRALRTNFNRLLRT